MILRYSCRGECKRVDLKFKEMKLEPYLKSNRRGICKPCHSRDTIIRIQNKRADENPEDYMCCNSCDKTFRKFKQGRPVFKITGIPVKKLRTECPYCKSTDIEVYA